MSIFFADVVKSFDTVKQVCRCLEPPGVTWLVMLASSIMLK